eukprot:4143880-Amphidinium_carterae.1
MKKPSTSMRKPASVLKKPAPIKRKPSAFFMPIVPKRGRAPQAMRKPESRQTAVYTSNNHVR